MVYTFISGLSRILVQYGLAPVKQIISHAKQTNVGHWDCLTNTSDRGLFTLWLRWVVLRRHNIQTSFELRYLKAYNGMKQNNMSVCFTNTLCWFVICLQHWMTMFLLHKLSLELCKLSFLLYLHLNIYCATYYVILLQSRFRMSPKWFLKISCPFALRYGHNCLQI